MVLSSRIIPGNEKTIFRMIDHMSRRGADVLYGSMNPPLHVSGHASVEELRLVLNLVRPRYFVPIHGEYRQMAKHAAARRAPASFGPGRDVRPGDRRRLSKSIRTAREGRERVTVGRVCIDSGTVDEVVDDIVIRDRRHLSEDGIVLPIIAINKHTGRMRERSRSGEPRIFGR